MLAALALAHFVVDRTHPTTAGVAARVHEGLLGWDAGWYEAIARFGYGPLGRGSLRFFPLFPLAARALAFLPGVSAGAALVVLANVASLLGTALLYVLARRETGDSRLALRAAWLVSLVPPAFTLVMGYAEGMLLLFTTACFLAVRPASGTGAKPWWWVAAAAGFAAALTRPLGVLLVLPVACEAVRWWRRSERGLRWSSVVAVAAPVAGLLAYLGWAGASQGNFWAPLRVQEQAGHHGGLADPFRTLVHDASGALHRHVGTALHVPWVGLVLVLLILVWMRWPASYGAFATAVVVVALSGTNLDSFERYALSAFPLVLVGAGLTSGARVERVVLTLAAAGLVGYSLLAFLNLSVP